MLSADFRKKSHASVRREDGYISNAMFAALCNREEQGTTQSRTASV